MSKKLAPSKEAEKGKKFDKIAKILVQVLENAGVVVRKEELKRGFGWKVVSGSCRLNDDRILFIDRKMPAEDQVAFLATSIRQRAINISEEFMVTLSELGWQMENSTESQFQI